MDTQPEAQLLFLTSPSFLKGFIMKKAFPFLVLLVSLLSGCASSSMFRQLPPTSQLDAKTFLSCGSNCGPALKADEHLKPIQASWLASWPGMALALSQEYKQPISHQQHVGPAVDPTTANANSMLNVSSAGIASGAGAPGLGGVMIGADLLQRLFSSTPIDYMNVAQADFFRPYTEQEAHEPLSAMAPILQQQMQILAAMHEGTFYAPLAFKGKVYMARKPQTERPFDFSMNAASFFTSPGFYRITWVHALNMVADEGKTGDQGNIVVGLKSSMHNFYVRVGGLPGNKMLSVSDISDLQRKLPFLKDWYAVFNTYSDDNGPEWVIVKDGKVLDSISMAE